jgi:hypothetical protein
VDLLLPIENYLRITSTGGSTAEFPDFLLALAGVERGCRDDLFWLVLEEG